MIIIACLSVIDVRRPTPCGGCTSLTMPLLMHLRKTPYYHIVLYDIKSLHHVILYVCPKTLSPNARQSWESVLARKTNPSESIRVLQVLSKP